MLASTAVLRKIIFSSALLLLTIICSHLQAAAQAKPQNAADSCAKFGDAFQSNNDLVALKGYRSAVQRLVDAEDFQQLDCVADAARINKSRFHGGKWQLYTFYRGASDIEGHATEEDWNNRIGHLKNWTSANPKSITAAVALAQAYVNFAWHARGDGMGDTVTDSGWRLFAQRAAKAKSILDDASSLPAKCPHWYVSMLTVARAQGWDVEQSTELVKQATAAFPDYYYSYGSLATYLLPKWGGEEGDAATFAQQSADHVGGAKGDMLYFRIGERIVCACDEPEFNRFSWARLQKGYEAIEKEYGSSDSDLNVLALMATKNNDSVVADAAFKRIGNNYDEEKWITEEFFKQMKEWAANMAPAEARSRKIEVEADANAQTPEGSAYKKQAEQAVTSLVQECAKGAEDKSRFGFMLQIGQDGIPKDGWVEEITSVSRCLAKSMYDSSQKKEALFAKPPRADYWIKLTFDPGVSVAAK
jgi:hypothetical protein